MYEFLDLVKIVLIALIVVLPIRYFLFQPFIVNGQSMEPTYCDRDCLLVDQISYRFKEPQRGEVIVFYYPEDVRLRHIKRIVGLPGETISITNDKIEVIDADGNILEIDESEYLPFNTTKLGEVELVLPEDSFFVMGDNRGASFDSRKWGYLPKEYIIGKVFLRAYPFQRFELIEAPAY